MHFAGDALREIIGGHGALAEAGRVAAEGGFEVVVG
jgi:hypothetical protein